MTRRIVSLARPSDARQAHEFVDRAFKAGGYCVEFKKATRSLDQNAKLWASLGEIAKARPEHCGIRMSAEDYKTLFMHALNKETRMVPDLDGQGFVPLGYQTSKLNKQEFSDLLEIIHAWCAREGIALRDGPQERQDAA